MKNSFLLLIIILFTFSCNPRIETKDHLNNIPFSEEYRDVTPGYFFDKGSWFGIQLPDNGFGLAAPYILSDSNGYTLPENIFKLEIEYGKKIIDSSIKSSMLPGVLFQQFKDEVSEVTIKSIFTDHQTVLICLMLKNNGQDQINYGLNWRVENADTIIDDKFIYDLGNAILEINLNKQIHRKENSHQNVIGVKPGMSMTHYFTVRHRFKEENPFTEYDFSKAETFFVQNQKRWSEYIEPYKSLSKEKRILATKCIQTMINNWRVPMGELKHAGLFPSYAYKGFQGFWAWDSWKHAVALCTFEPELAKDQIRSMFDFQNQSGMIADCIFRDTLIENHNWRNTKPPLAAWSIYKIFENSKDTTFVKEMFPKLIKYHEWWYANRDHNQNGLCEYGSTDGTIVAAAWESGMDNAVRFDNTTLTNINETAWSFEQESVDLNSYLYAEKNYLSQLSQILGQQKLQAQYESEAIVLQEQIRSNFYNKKYRYFFDINTSDGSFVEVVGPEAWICLWSGAATDNQAKNIVAKIMDTTHFNTYLPFPTLSASHPEFNPEQGYWRGPVWLDQAYFALEGMKNYGYQQEYSELIEKIYIHAEGLLNKGTTIRENYDPRNGKGLNAKHFSWSAAHLFLLLQINMEI